MRTRTRDLTAEEVRSNVIALGSLQSNLNPVYRPSDSPVSLNCGSNDRIDDVIGEFEGENPCYHYCETTKWSSPVPYSIDRVGSPIGNVISGSLSHSGSGLGPKMSSHASLINHPTTPDTSRRTYIPDYSGEGWQNVYPVIREEFKLLNSIYELKDFARLPALARQTRRGMRSLDELSQGYKWQSEAARKGELRILYKILDPQSSDTWSKLLELPRKRVVRLSLQDMLRHLISVGAMVPAHFLNWKFAVSPMIRDMEALARASMAVDRQLHGLLERADGSTVHKSHWSTIVPWDQILGADLVSRDEANWTGPYSQVHTKNWREEIDPAKYTFTARYTYKYPEMTYELARKLAMRDATGQTLSASNLWQATPWTFVVDWFVGIGKTLEQITPHNLEPVVNFYGASHSIKYAFQSGQDCYPYKEWQSTSDGTWSWTGLGPRTVATRMSEVYVRNNVIPFVSIPKTSDFSTIEKLLALALGLSSVRYSS